MPIKTTEVMLRSDSVLKFGKVEITPRAGIPSEVPLFGLCLDVVIDGELLDLGNVDEIELRLRANDFARLRISRVLHSQENDER